MSSWAQRARAHFSEECKKSTTETTERPHVFSGVHPEHTTETTETPLSMVLTVQSGRFCENHEVVNQAVPAANDPAPTPTKAAVLPPADIGTVMDIGTIRPPGLSAKLLAASLALDAQIQAAGPFDNSDENSDRWCWPHSTAMNGSEIDLFTARLARFTTKGVIHGDAELIADKLVMRDRDDDDRALCLACTHLAGYGRTSWRCGNWQAAGVARQARDAQLPAVLTFQLQRCNGFAQAAERTPT